MISKEIYGLSRSRDKQGKVVKRSLNDYVNCIHTQVGSARDNMEVYVIEIMEEAKIINPLKGQSDNGWHFEQQVYDAEGIARAVKAGEGSGNIPKVIEVGRVKEGKHQQDFVQHEEGICRCICTGHHASTPHLLKTMVSEPISVAMRGRNPNNPSERGKSNGNYKQRLEMNESGVANTITSVQKDSMVAEPRVEQVGNIYPDTDTFKNRTMGRVYSNEGLSPTINCCGGGDREPKIVVQKFGDRGTDQCGVRDIAHTIPANLMSDRGQMLLEPTEEYKYIDYEQITETNTRKVLCVLQHEVGEKKIQWAVGRFVGIFKEEILRQRVYEESICECREYDTRLQPRTSLFEEDNVSTSRQRNALRDMRSNQEYRCASQGFQLSEQFTREFNDIVSQLSYEDAQTKECLSYLWKTCQGIQSMQQTLSALEEVWRPLSSALEYIQPQKYRIRKLTCREVFRLMGVDDADIDKIQASGISNSQQYKCAGNSIVVDVLYHIFRKMLCEVENENDQLTLF